MLSPRNGKHLLCLLIVLFASLSTLLSGGRPARANWIFSNPPNLVTLNSGHRNNVFYAGSSIKFTLTISNYGTYALQSPITYQVRDYTGALVDSGTVPAPIPARPSTLTSSVSQPGWYKLSLHGGAGTAPWGDSVGSTMFEIFRPDPNFPVMPSPNLPNNSTVFDGDEVARGVLGMGPQRHPVNDASQPAAAIAALDPSIAEDKQYYTPFDPQRSRPLMIAFPNGVGSSDPVKQAANLAGLTQLVQHYHNDVKYWEPLNEPNGTYDGADYVNKELKPFYETVKSVDPTCKVLGPAVVTIGPSGLTWIEGFLQAGGGNYIDAFSFHAYNNMDGDLMLARQSLNALQALLTKYGIGNIEKWQTEQGYFAACYGAYEPRLQGRWTMLQMMVYEQYGIPKEHNHLWYDRSHGFWSYPAFWENEDGPYSAGSFDPAASLMRVWSEELYGTNFVSAYDFGATGNKQYLGSLFGGPGKQVAAFMSAGRTDGQVTLNVSSGSSLHVVSAFGVEQDLPIIGGQVTLPVPELPVYVEPAAGQTLAVAPIDYGTDLALLPGTTASASGSSASPLNASYGNDPAKIINGVLENWYWNQGPNDHPWMSNNASFPGWVQITLPSPMRINHVIVYAGVPWQNDSSLLDYQLQYDNNGTWVTLAHPVEPTNVVDFFTPTVFCSVDSFYSDRCIFEHDFAPVTTQKIRLLVNNTTYGGAASADVVTAGGQPGPHQITLREIELYGPDGVALPSPSGKVRFFPRAGSPDRMIGGTFQGSTDGVSYTNLYTITTTPTDGQWTEAPVTADPKYYRYLRYLSPSGSYGNVAEVEFYTGTGASAIKLTGTPFGTPGSYKNSGSTFAKVFDGSTATYFDGPTASGNYAGIDQGSPATTPPPTVTGVSVSPATATVSGGQTQAFSATVTGTNSPSQSVTWAASAGSVDASGLFTAPAATSTPQAVTVTATSAADGTKSATATITIPAAIVASGTGTIRFYPRPGCANRMKTGQFQGSTDGVTYMTLYTILIVPTDGQWTTVTLTTDPKAFRYLRYLSPNSSYGNVAEVEFYTGTGTSAVKLTGTPFGTPGSYKNSGSTFAKVFDGSTATYFDGPTASGNYAGIDQGSASPVTPPPTGGGPLAIGFLGDSITYGIGDSGGPGCYDWTLTDLALNGYQVSGVNNGSNGASVASYYQQTAGPLQAFEKAGVSVVSIMLGTNDAQISIATSPQDYHDKLLWIINSFLAPGTGIQKVILNYSPYIQPTHSSPLWDTTADSRLLTFQAQIDLLCNGTTILQGDKTAYTFFQQHPEQGDGVHPTPPGHQDLGALWAIAITNALGGTNTVPYPTGTASAAP